MSTEDEVELRDLVIQTLETNGCLAKIRAQLRASIFLALEDDDQKKQPMINKKLRDYLQTNDGKLVLCLIREFLEFFSLDSTISVYESESYLGTEYVYNGREEVIKDLGIKEDTILQLPVLSLLVQMTKVNNKNSKKNININLTELQNVDFNEKNTKISDSESQYNNKLSDEKSTNSSILEDLSKSSIVTETNNLPYSLPDVPQQQVNLNETFNISSSKSFPTQNNSTNQSQLNAQKLVNSPVNKEVNNCADVSFSPKSTDSTKSSDTSDGASSFTEDSIKDQSTAEDLLKNYKSKSTVGEYPEKSKNGPDQTDLEFSPPIVKDSKPLLKFEVSFEKLKSPQKAEKLKVKSAMSSLSDLPPLPHNKSRNDSPLLPSLYSKEFKDICNIRESDKFLEIESDSLDNYEEDFMSSEIESNQNEDILSTKSLLEEMQQAANKSPSVKSNSSISHKNGSSPEINKTDKLIKTGKFNDASDLFKKDVDNLKKDKYNEQIVKLSYDIHPLKLDKHDSSASLSSCEVELKSSIDNVKAD